MGIIAGLARAKLEVIQKMKVQKKSVESFEDETVSIYIDKAWEGISYILVGAFGERENILSEIIYPKEHFIIYEDEYTTEQVNYSNPERVKQIHRKIISITKDNFKELFSKRDFQNVNPYPGFWDNSNEEHFEYFHQNFQKIQELFKSASIEDEFIVVTID